MKKLLQMKFMLLLCALIVGSGTMWAEEETIASFSASVYNGGTTNEWTVTNADYATANSGYYKLISNDAFIVTPNINWSDYKDITITISARKYGGPDATQGKISVSQGTTELASYSPSGTSIAASSALAITPADGTITISCPGASSSKGCGVQSIVIKGTKKASTSPLDFITLSGTYPTSFTEGDEFSHEGMTVTATYEDESTADVTSSASFTGYDMTVLGQNQTVTVSYSEGEVTRTAEYTIIVNALPKHSVTWSVNGTESEPESYKEGAAITFPANPADIEGKSFVGWTETAISGTTDEKPTFVTSATMGEADVTYYAVFAEIEGEPGWTETALSDIEDTDIFVFSNGSYAMSNDNGASAAPAAVAITVKDGKITSVVADNLKWNVSGNATGGYTFYPNGSTTTWMYCNTTASSSSNNNIRVGDGTRKSWIFDDNNYLVTNDSYTDRYLSIYGNSDFRGYLNTSNGAFVPKFYKYSEGSYSGYCTTVAADTREEAGLSFAESTATVEWYVADQYTGQNLTNPNNVSPITWTSSNEEVATVENGTVTVLALGETTIKAKFEGNDDYKPGEASYTLTVVDNRQTATVTWKDADGNNITELNVEKGDFIQGITLSCNVEGFTFTEKHLQHLWGTNETHDNYIGLQPAGYIFTPNAVWTAALGITTITATFPGNETHKPASATLTVTVTGGTATAPYTVAEARAAIDAGTGTNDVYAKGIVSEIVTALNNSGQITYNISEDGTTTSDQLQAYRGKGIGGANFTSEDDIKVGDVVVIYGNLTKYGSTYEFAQNNQLYFNQPRLTVADEDKTVTVNAEGQIKNHDAQTITINYRNFLETTPSANNVSVLFCDVNGTVAAESYDWIKSIEFNENGNGNFTMNCLFEANDGEARTGYVKVSVSTDDAIYYSDIITITQSAPATSHTATFYVNGTQISPVEIETGSAIDFPEVSDIDGMTFLGWTDNEISGTQASANYVTEATMGDGDVTYYAVFALLVPGTSTTYTDELTHDLIGVTGTSYSNWSGITDNSGAVYAGNSAGGNDAIQLRTNNSNSGIVTTTSGGKLKKVTVEWNSETDDARVLDIYGKNTAYSSAGDLYNNTSQGTSIGSIAKNGTTYELSVNGDYEYVGLRSHSGAMYLDKITIEWETGTSDTYSDYCTTIPAMLTVTIAEACTDGEGKYYGTYSSSSAFKVPANVTVSEIGITAKGKMDVHNYDSGAVVPANTGVMVSATTFGEHKLIISSEEGTPIPDFTNALRPTGDDGVSAADMEGNDSNCKFYRLTMHNGTDIGFWWGNENGTAFAVGSNKAYMAVPTSVAGTRNGFAFGDDATGISNVNVNENVNGSVFDLQGRKVSTPGKGLYIVNGKKVVIK